MTFQLKTSARLFHLHGTIGLTDWDMDTELTLATTTDQHYYDARCGLLPNMKVSDPFMGHMPSPTASGEDDYVFYDKTSDTFVNPSPWLFVNPNIVCPIRSRGDPADPQPLCGHAMDTPLLEAAEVQPARPDELQEELLRPLSSAPEYMDWENLKPGCWPRPPVTYSIIIALALKSSLTGSLKVQQIYSFTRQHFPFFQTAPDAWKNAIRHNLCFNNSFRKTCNQLYRDGKRKSCFWHLTLDGHRQLADEISMLTGESLKQLERSMAHPDVIWSLLAL